MFSWSSEDQELIYIMRSYSKSVRSLFLVESITILALSIPCQQGKCSSSLTEYTIAQAYAAEVKKAARRPQKARDVSNGREVRLARGFVG